MRNSYILYLPVETRNQESGEPTGVYTLVQYELTETEYAFKATELEIHVIDCGDADEETVGYALRNHYEKSVILEMTFQTKRVAEATTQRWADHIGKTVNATYAIERNRDGADVPVLQQGEVTIELDSDGDIVLNVDGDRVYPFENTFNLTK